MTSPEQQLLIERTRAVFQADPRVESLWLSGSLGTGHGDLWSDVDFVVVALQGEAAEAVCESYMGELSDIADVVHVIRPFPRLISAIAADWARFDLLFVSPAEIAMQRQGQLKELLRKDGAAVPVAATRAGSARPLDVEALAREFMRVVGLGPGVLARGHTLMALDGMSILRGLCIDLMLAEHGKTRDDASPKRLESLLTEEQRSALKALPPLSPEHGALLAYQQASWGLFIPRAKALAASRGTAWPADFESVTRNYVTRTLGMALD